MAAKQAIASAACRGHYDRGLLCLPLLGRLTAFREQQIDKTLGCWTQFLPAAIDDSDGTYEFVSRQGHR